MSEEPLRLLILGAHPDDAEYHAGGLASIYRDLGHTVKMVSLTNGDAGHHEKPRAEVAGIRREEAAASGWNEFFKLNDRQGFLPGHRGHSSGTPVGLIQARVECSGIAKVFRVTFSGMESAMNPSCTPVPAPPA